MDLNLRTLLAATYTSKSQIARVLTEAWVKENVFCPNCGNVAIHKYENNKPAADFFCALCKEDFELKGSRSPFRDKITGAAYSLMIERLNSATNPNFFLLQYQDGQVKNFSVIPKHYFTAEIVDKRKPLSVTAKRAGWTGCNINIAHIPPSGKIYYVRDGVVMPKDEVLNQWRKTLFLRTEPESISKGWLLDVMSCIDLLHQEYFTLTEIYNFEVHLASLHPQNRYIKDKIRQQLQKLRDHGYIKFISKGKYKKTTML